MSYVRRNTYGVIVIACMVAPVATAGDVASDVENLRTAPELIKQLTINRSINHSAVLGSDIRFVGVAEPMEREEILSELVANDVQIRTLRTTVMGGRIADVLSNKQYTRIEFARLEFPNPMQVDSADEIYLGNTASFSGLKLRNSIVKELSSGVIEWQASIASEYGGDAAIIVSKDGASGIIQDGDKLYDVTPIGKGLHAVSLKKKISELPSPDDVYELPEEASLFEYESKDLNDGKDGALGKCKYKTGATSKITVVAGYTPAAEAMAQAEGKDIKTLVHLAAVVGNTTFRNSDIPVELEVVGIVKLENYPEYTEGFTAEIIDLKASTDIVSPLLNVRRSTKADVAILVTNREGVKYCGLAAGIKVRPEDALAAVNWRCMSELFSYVHEIGHLVGAWHNPEVVASHSSKLPLYAFGYVATKGPSKFSTIMGYPNTCNPYCNRTWNWSNPDIRTPLFDNEPTGTERNNNACLWRERAPIVAKFGETLYDTLPVEND